MAWRGASASTWLRVGWFPSTLAWFEQSWASSFLFHACAQWGPPFVWRTGFVSLENGKWLFVTQKFALHSTAQRKFKGHGLVVYGGGSGQS